jgi:HPt (histidine-containing phosphotransfer) domain-containing protein
MDLEERSSKDQSTAQLELFAQESSNQIHDLPGALRRVGGKEATLIRLLQQFKNNHRFTAQHLTEKYNEDDLEGVFKVLHGLAGTSGNLGLLQLYREASAAADIFRSQSAKDSHDQKPAFDSSLYPVLKSLEDSLAYLNAWLQDNAQNNKVPHQDHDVNIEELINNLNIAIVDNDASALDWIIQLEAQHKWVESDLQYLMQIRKALEEFEFDTAAECFKTWQQSNKE